MDRNCKYIHMEQKRHAQKAQDVSKMYRKFSDFWNRDDKANTANTANMSQTQRGAPGKTPRSFVIVNRAKQAFAQDPVMSTIFLHSVAMKRAFLNLSPDLTLARQQIGLLCTKMLNMLEIQRADVNSIVQYLLAPESVNA